MQICTTILHRFLYLCLYGVIQMFCQSSMTPMVILNHISQDFRDAQVSTKSFVSRKLLQVRRDGYLVHYLLLDFAKKQIEGETREPATSRQAQYLGRLDVLKAYQANKDQLSRGYYDLIALWRLL